jgi:hypothetical protein
MSVTNCQSMLCKTPEEKISYIEDTWLPDNCHEVESSKKEDEIYFLIFHLLSLQTCLPCLQAPASFQPNHAVTSLLTVTSFLKFVTTLTFILPTFPLK